MTLLVWSLLLMDSLSCGQAQDIAPLKANDSIQFQISGVEPSEAVQMSHAYRISEQGTINLLYLGAVSAAGLKPSELEQKIAKLYRDKEVYTQPTISISVDGDGTQRPVYVSGKVVRPGLVAYRPGLTVAKAITSVGGPTEFGNMSKVQLRRGGKPLGVLNLAKANSQAGETLVQPDDEVIVSD